MAATGRALSRLSRAFARAHVARGAAPVAVAREWDVTFDDAVQVVFQ